MMIKTNYKDIFNLDKARINELDPHIKDVLAFWKSERSYLIVNTSGSTGNPKPIKLKREHKHKEWLERNLQNSKQLKETKKSSCLIFDSKV